MHNNRYLSVRFWLLLVSALGSSHGVFAHITLEQASVESSAYYKAVLRVGHGCDGLPTTQIRVQLPAGFQAAKPMPKGGWSLAYKIEKLPNPYQNHGKMITEDVTEIIWTALTAQAALKDQEYDEFILRGKAEMPAGAAWFKVTQQCQLGEKTLSQAWIETPAPGSSTKGLRYPAVLLQVIAAPAITGTPHKH